MAIEYALRIRDAVMDDRFRDLLIAAEPSLQIDHEFDNPGTQFTLYNHMLWMPVSYRDMEFRVPGRPRVRTNASVWFRHQADDKSESAKMMLRIVLHLLDHMDNDMRLTFVGEAAILARVGGELLLSTQADFWDIRERKHMLYRRDHRMVPLGDG